MITVLGVDVGLQVTGYVVCNLEKLKIHIIEEGQIVSRKNKSLPAKLLFIYKKLNEVISRLHPEAIVVEKLYSHYRHPTTMATLAQVRGVTLLAAQMAGLKFFEYAPTKARKSFLGKGNVSSEQVKKMADNFYGRKMLSQHTADALSLIVAFSHERKIEDLIGNLPKRQKVSLK